MSPSRSSISLPVVMTALFMFLSATCDVDAQSGPLPARSTEETPAARVRVSLFGGWASFSQTRTNHLIRMDNLLLTASVADGGAGLDRGLDHINDSLTGGIEIGYRLKGNWEAVVGVERLQASSRIDFDYDSGSGPLASFLEYRTSDWPIHAGLRYTFRFSERYAYRVGFEAVVFPASRLNIAGRLGGLVALDQEGTVTGVGAGLTWSGEMKMGGPLSLQGTVRLRFGRAGDPKDADGDVIVDPIEGKAVTLDWSGVDILLGVLIDLF